MKDEPEEHFDFKLTEILQNPLEWGWSSWTLHEVLVHFHIALVGGVPVVQPNVMILRGIDVTGHLLKGKELSVSMKRHAHP